MTAQSLDVRNDEASLSDDFKAIFRNHPGRVAIVTADTGQGPAGLTATSLISVSANPPVVAFSLSSISSAAPTIAHASTVLIHLLSGNELELAQRFATSGIDRFEDPESWIRLGTGEPLLTAASTWLRGRVVQRIDAAGSTVVLAEVMDAHIDVREQAPLIYHNRNWHQLDIDTQL